MNFKDLSQPLVLGVAAAAMLLAAAPSTLRAESGVPDPGAFGIPVDPHARGTKVASSVAFAYEYETGTPRASACDSQRWVRNLHVIATVQKANKAIQVFSSNYQLAGKDNLQDCFDNQANQLAFFRYVIEEVVIAGLHGCVPGGCPPYAVKSITDFLTTGVGGASLQVELAVQ